MRADDMASSPDRLPRLAPLATVLAVVVVLTLTGLTVFVVTTPPDPADRTTGAFVPARDHVRGFSDLPPTVHFGLGCPAGQHDRLEPTLDLHRPVDLGQPLNVRQAIGPGEPIRTLPPANLHPIVEPNDHPDQPAEPSHASHADLQ